MTLLWNGDFQTGDRSQWGGWEYGGTFDGTPPLDQRLFITKEYGGLRGPRGDDYFAAMMVAPGDQYGGSTGWRLLGRPHEPIRPMAEGYDSTWVYAIALPADFPPNVANPDSRVWVAGLELHHSNGVNGAPAHIAAQPDSFDIGVAGGDLSKRTVSIDQSFGVGYKRSTWYVVALRYRHSVTDGDAELAVGRVGVDQELTPIVARHHIPTMYAPYQGVPLYNYALFGLYVAQVGTLPTVICMSGNREYSTLAEGVAYAKTLLGGPAPAPAPSPAERLAAAERELTAATITYAEWHRRVLAGYYHSKGIDPATGTAWGRALSILHAIEAGQ